MKLRQVINGKRYDTTTATFVADVSPRGFYGNDFRSETTHLYRTSKGNWFIAGEGGPLSRWAAKTGLHGATNGCGIRALSSDEALELLERHECTGAIEEWFENVIEDA